MAEVPSPQVRARALYPNQGLHKNADFIASLHPRAIDYLEQAPVLAMAFGVKVNTRADRLYTAMRIGGPIGRGERLRAVMGAVGMPLPLRKLSASALFPKHYETIRLLSEIDASTVAQTLPEGAGRQRTWFKAIGDFNSRCILRYYRPTKEIRRWVIRQAAISGAEASEAQDLADYLHAHPNAPLDRWTWQRAMLEVTLWHDRLATEKSLPGGISADTRIDLSPWPDHCEVGGYEFFKLATPSMIMEEGRRMRHCVASYMADVMGGKTSIFSIRQEMRRVATVQIVGKRVVQIKAFANKAVSKSCRDVADIFARQDAAT